MRGGGIACEIVEVIPVSVVKRQDSWWGEETGWLVRRSARIAGGGGFAT